MADEKISAMTEDATPGDTAYFPYVDPTEVADADKNKRITVADMRKDLNPVKATNWRSLSDASTGYAALTTHDRVSLGDAFGGVSDTYYFPFAVGREITISHLSVDVYTAASGGFRKVALFEDSGGAPGDHVTNSTCIFDIGTIAYVTVALASNITIGPGLYWMGMKGDANNGAAIRCTTGKTAFAAGIINPGASIHNDLSNWCRAATSPSYAAFPESTASAVTFSSGTENIPYLIATLV